MYNDDTRSPRTSMFIIFYRRRRRIKIMMMDEITDFAENTFIEDCTEDFIRVLTSASRVIYALNEHILGKETKNR